MKKNKLSIICSLMIVPLLMSASSYTTDYKSNVTNKNITAIKKISEGSNSGECLSNVLNNVAARITFTYELYKMYKYTEILTKYVDSYTLIYRVNIYVNNNVHYKGGVFNMFNGYNPAYLKKISIISTFNSLTNIQRHNVTPSGTGVYSLREVNPYYNEYPTDYNYLIACYQILQTNTSFESMSYSNPCDEFYDEDYGFDSRISARLVTTKTLKETSLSYYQSFEYNYKIDSHIKDAKKINYKKIENELYSGPEKDGEPFNFAFYGAINFESESEPKNSSIKINFETNHGSTVALDKFSSSTTLNFKF